MEAKDITPEPEDEEKLELYAFYKQAIVGDVNTGDYFTFCVENMARVGLHPSSIDPILVLVSREISCGA